MERTIVTGSNGLVGYALRQLQFPNAHFLTRDQVDLTDFNLTRQAFKIINPQRVIHLAAQVGGLGGNLIHSGEYFRNVSVTRGTTTEGCVDQGMLAAWTRMRVYPC